MLPAIWCFQFKDITKFQWLIELKYIKESERNTLEKVKQEGLIKLKSYEQSKLIQEEFQKDELRKVLFIVLGKSDIYIENL